MTSQVARFVRLFVFALAPALVAIATGQTPLTTAAVSAACVGALEVAWRNYSPTTPATTTTQKSGRTMEPPPPAPPTVPPASQT